MGRQTYGKIFALILMVGLAGCDRAVEKSVVAPVPAVAQPASTGELLADGKISRTEYETAVGNVQKCLAHFDVTLINAGWNPIHRQRMVLDFRNTALSGDQVSAYGEECLRTQLTPVESVFVANTEPVMERHLLAAVRHCLIEHGVVTDGNERNGPDLLRSATARDAGTVRGCVSRMAGKLYPGHPMPIELENSTAARPAGRAAIAGVSGG